MNIIELETPVGTNIFSGPRTDNRHPFYITNYGVTFRDTPCYQLRMPSDISCIQYVISGSGVIINDKSIYTVSAGDTFLLREGENQIYYSNPDNQFERIWINFKGILARELISIYDLDKTTVFRNTDTKKMLKEIHQKCHCISDPDTYKNETSVMFLKLIQFLSENKGETVPIDSTVEKIRLYIDLHITENITLSDISKEFFLSPEHIIRTFSRNYGITPHRYIIQSKMRIAMILLRSTDKSVEEISNELSFSDPHHFSAQFKKNVGCRPSEYRKNPRIK